MKIDKIILDELKKYPYIRSGFDKPALEDIALSIAIKLENEFASREDVPEIKRLNKKEVLKILRIGSIYMYNLAMGDLEKMADKICKLAISEQNEVIGEIYFNDGLLSLSIDKVPKNGKYPIIEIFGA